ncbi:MAG: hypothetical protein DBY37_00060 [Desulfovibrionaceae bacterium]|nr:MAG: hypothetical protein DBY37_00060 [Desulfovibrionaceae bacterium]
MEGGTEYERGVFHAKRKRERVPARQIGRDQQVAVKGLAERSLWAVKPREGSSKPTADTWRLISAVAIRKAHSSSDDCRSPV